MQKKPYPNCYPYSRWKSNDVILSKRRERSKKVYEQFFSAMAGTTLVAAHIFQHNKLRFWCVGDSDSVFTAGKAGFIR